jgi:hypothetical protein
MARPVANACIGQKPMQRLCHLLKRMAKAFAMLSSNPLPYYLPFALAKPSPCIEQRHIIKGFAGFYPRSRRFNIEFLFLYLTK